jgi:hypothetical protein
MIKVSEKNFLDIRESFEVYDKGEKKEKKLLCGFGLALVGW